MVDWSAWDLCLTLIEVVTGSLMFGSTSDEVRRPKYDCPKPDDSIRLNIVSVLK